METKTESQMNYTGNIDHLAISCHKSQPKLIKKINVQCLSPEHFPPSYIVLEAGEYEYVCPQCGCVTNFTVPMITT